MRGSRVVYRAVLALLLVVVIQAPVAAATLEEANALVRAGRPGEALTVLAPLAEAEAGNPLYHYVLGLARLDSGDIAGAIDALEHSLELDPGLLQARAELGRAHVLNGDAIAAWRSFEAVRAGDPPPEVLAGMERYIAASAAAIGPPRRLYGALTVTIGHDDNVNWGTSTTEVALPLFGGIRATLATDSRPRSDEFLSLGGYVSGTAEVAEGLEVVGDLSASGKYNRDDVNRDFDTEYAAVAAGLRYTLGRDQVRALARHEWLDYDQELLRREPGFELGWRHVLPSLPLELDLGWRHTRLDYRLDPDRDADRDVLTLSVRPAFFGHRLQDAGALGSVWIGEESARRAQSRHLGYRLWGARASYLYPLATSTSLYVSAGYEQRQHDARDPTFLDTRRDHQLDAWAGVWYRFDERWSLVPSVQWIRTASNIDVYDTERLVYGLTLRMGFGD